MAPVPEDSPVSSPRTRSPVKGTRTMNANCSSANAMSMLNMLAEVASVTLHTDPSVTDAVTNQKSKINPPVSKKPSDYEVLTLDHVSGMTDNLLVKLFSKFESNEMWKRFTYTCQMLPAACSMFFQSFGSEHKARAGVKAHLQNHLKNLLEINSSEESRLSYVLESVPARKRRQTERESPATKKRSTASGSRSKANSVPRVTNQEAVPKVKKNVVESSRDQRVVESLLEIPTFDVSPPQAPPPFPPLQESKQPKLKRKLENKEGKVRTKKAKCLDVAPSAASDDCNNNNNIDVKIDMQDVIEPSYTTPPMQEIVSHDHGYLKASTSDKPDILVSKDHIVQGTTVTYKETQPHPKSLPSQVSPVRTDGSVTDCVSVCVKENHEEDKNTLLHQHMNQELEGGIMAHDSGSDATPLPVVGSEVEFTPEQQYKVMRSADLPVVFDHNNPTTSIQTVSRIIERDEYKVRKKPKGRAKFIGQSKAEKEMALKLITEIRSQSVMALGTLECKICHPPRLFTALSTLLSHYRSHAGIRPYECRICEAVFTRQHSLNYHMLIHTNQTRFTCVDCGRKFRHPSHFKEHRRRHTGESPYECSDCLMRFKTRNTYKRHLRTRHGKLLTTQGAIIILSQEEADRMKKTQGRKPRRPRQPLQIISPETAAQIEEEQIWTDFEEGDREEEEEDDEDDEEDEEEDDQSPLDLTKKAGHIRFDSHMSPDALCKAFGVQQRGNGKTGLIVRPTKVSIRKSDVRPKLEILVDTKNVNNSVVVNKGNGDIKEEIKEEVKEESDNCVTEDFRTFVFHPTPQQSTAPKVNVKSSLNTVNIDLKSLERNAKPALRDVVYCDGQSILEAEQVNKVTEQVTSILPENDSDFVGDSINPEEVITICAGVDNSGKSVVLSPQVQSSWTSGLKADSFTVKKPLKCYGRPVYTSIESSNVFSTSAVGATNQVDSQGPGVYFFVQGQDGRLARVYQGTNGSLVNKTNRQVTVQSTSQTRVNPAGDSQSASCKVKTLPTKTIKFESKYSKDETSGQSTNTSLTSSRVLFKPMKALSHRSAGLGTSNSKVVINKQVVNNVVVNNHIVQNGNLVKVQCEEHDSPYHSRTSTPLVSVVPVTSSVRTSPVIVTSVAPMTKTAVKVAPVIVTSVASVSNAENCPSGVSLPTLDLDSAATKLSEVAQVGIPPTPSQPTSSSITYVSHIPNTFTSGASIDNRSQEAHMSKEHQPLLENSINKCINETPVAMENRMTQDNKSELNHLIYSEVDSLVAMGEELLLENVEIIESSDVSENVNGSIDGITGQDSLGKLEHMHVNGTDDGKNNLNLLTFSGVESAVGRNTQYVSQLIEEHLPIQNVADSSDIISSPVPDSLTFPQDSREHLMPPVHTVSHIVSLPSSAALKT